MQDHPTAPELLWAMAERLSESVMPQLDGTVRHEVRVIANLCRILARESETEGSLAAATRLEVAELLGSDLAEPATALRRLDAAIASGQIPVNEKTLSVLRRNVERRLAVSRPNYR